MGGPGRTSGRRWRDHGRQHHDVEPRAHGEGAPGAARGAPHRRPQRSTLEHTQLCAQSAGRVRVRYRSQAGRAMEQKRLEPDGSAEVEAGDGRWTGEKIIGYVVL